MSNRAYDEIRVLVEQHGGTMKYQELGPLSLNHLAIQHIGQNRSPRLFMAAL